MDFSNIQQSDSIPIFSPCSEYFIVMSNSNIYIKQSCLDLKNYSQISIKENKNNESKTQYPIPKFSPDSKLIALQFKKKIQIYDIQGRLKIRIREDGEVLGSVWVPDSKQIIVFFSNSFNCNIYNVRTETQCLIRNPKLSSQLGVTFSRQCFKQKSYSGTISGKFAAILQKHNGKDCVGIYFIQNWQLISHITLQSYDACKIQFTANGYLVVYENKINFKIYFVDVVRGVIQTYGNKDYVMGVSISNLSNKADFFMIGAYDDCLHLFNATTWKLIAQISVDGQFDTKKTLFIKQQKEGQFIHNDQVKLKKIVGNKKESQNSSPFTFSILQFSPNDYFFAVKHDSFPNYVFIYSVKKLQLYSVIQLSSSVRDFKWLENQQDECYLCIASGKPNLFVWKDNQNMLFEIEVPKKNNSQLNVGKIELGNKGRIIFYSASMKKYVYSSYSTYSLEQ